MEQTKKRRGGRPRSRRKLSYTGKFYVVNREFFSEGPKRDFRKIKEVR